MVEQVRSLKLVSLLLLSQLLGKMISYLAIVPWARLHTRALQWLLLPSQRSGHSNSLVKIRVPKQVICSLDWWTSVAMEKGCLFQEPPQLVLTSDASLFSWDAHLNSSVTQGWWSQQDLLNNINWLELKVTHLALHHFQLKLSDHHVLLLMDNVTAKAHINRCMRQGTYVSGQRNI